MGQQPQTAAAQRATRHPEDFLGEEVKEEEEEGCVWALKGREHLAK